MKRTTRNAAKTKQEIIEKSAPVFNIHGYAGTKMSMLVEATGYQMGGIYRHFNTKMDLAKAAFEYNYETQIKRNIQFEKDLNPQEKLLTILENYKKMIVRPIIPGGCPLLNTAMEVDDTDKIFSQLTRAKVQELVKMLEEILKDGQSKGLFKPSINPHQEALYLFANFEGAIMLGQITKKIQSVFTVFDKMKVYLEESVFTTKK